PVEVSFTLRPSSRDRQVQILFETSCVTASGEADSGSSSAISEVLPARETQLSAVLEYDWVMIRGRTIHGEPTQCSHVVRLKTKLENEDDLQLVFKFRLNDH